ncbi:alpha/beta hydrolase [Serratia symbiotica]|uniref:alpha/beta fold hydrolase n=1 Tax=Serratia symbiotica TaxID=138074 RepID=UPI0020901930|nr:alpha/beta fold hydrolase [Serratia symbiotica]USS96366.1 alpha/beta hydrolase [Serratia symbiotica]
MPLIHQVVEVPLIHQVNASHMLPGNNGTVRLALTLLPGTGVKKGSLVVISGGLGQPGINPQLVGDARLRKSYDIVGYDPHGAGQSTPKITCQLAENNETLSHNSNDIPAAELQARKMINACIKGTGAEILQHMSTDEAVKDLNLIRHALGEPALTAEAYSYGTEVAVLYAERYPKKTRALVLDGVMAMYAHYLPLHETHSKYAIYGRTLANCARMCRYFHNTTAAVVCWPTLRPRYAIS